MVGANSGIGYATAKVIASASKEFHVILAARTIEKANAAKSELEAAGGILGQLSTVQIELTDKTSIDKAVASVEETFGHLDVLVSNAAVAGAAQPTADLKTRLQLCMDTNVIGTAVCAEAFRSTLLKSAKPYSIYVSSGMGSFTIAADPTLPYYKGYPRGEAYQASKSALNMLILRDAIASEETLLKVFAYCPGLVRSNLRGTSEEARSAMGTAGDPEVSGKGILAIINGERDA